MSNPTIHSTVILYTALLMVQCLPILSAPAVAGAFGFLPPFTGVGNHALGGKNIDVVSITDFNTITTPVDPNGVLDSSAGINACYAAARASGANIVVLWPYGAYKITRQINATGVSTHGDGAVFLGQFSSSVSGAAFSWGGNDCFVSGMNFKLSNSNTTLDMQGILNNVNNVLRQRFFNNTITSSTLNKKGYSNIYGCWCIGTGLSGLYVYGNSFEGTTYGFQLNNETSGSRSVITNPMGNPTHNVFVYDNRFVDSTIGINTPHTYCYNVQIHNNIIIPLVQTLDFPLNIAHVTGLEITGNSVTANASSSNGVIHLEDACQQATISNNTVVTTANNNGILISVASGVSKDIEPSLHIAVIGNLVRGSSATSPGIGISINDNSTIENIVANNHVSMFAQGIVACGDTDINNNSISDCGIGIDFAYNPGIASGNTFRRCAYIASNNNSSQVTLVGGSILGNTFAFKKNSTGVFLLNNVTLRQSTPTMLMLNTPFNVMPLPSYHFSGTITILFNSGIGFSKWGIAWNGATFTSTLLADAQLSRLGGLTLVVSGTTLKAQSSVASGSATFSVLMDGLVY